MRETKIQLVAALLFVQAWLAACGGDTPSDTPAVAPAKASPGAADTSRPAGAGASPAAANSGTMASASPGATLPSGDANAGAAGKLERPSSGGAGAAGSLEAGAPSREGAGGAGAGAATATATAAGSGGTPGTGSEAAADAIVRGEAPTDSTGTALGPFKVAMYTSGFADQPGFRAATIYYPADAEPPFAYVVFCPGWVSYQTSIRDWGPFLASHGIVIMTIDTNASGDSVTVRQTALKDALSSLQKETDRAESPLHGKLHESRFGLMGWSMGGGASLLNATMHTEYKSVVTVAAHLATSPGMAQPLQRLTVPVLMFAGTADTAILGLKMSQPAYETIPDTTTKMIYEVQNADHFFFNTPSALKGVVGKYALAWQKVFLEGDERYRKLLLDKGPMASDFRTNLR